MERAMKGLTGGGGEGGIQHHLLPATTLPTTPGDPKFTNKINLLFDGGELSASKRGELMPTTHPHLGLVRGWSFSQELMPTTHPHPVCRI